MARPGNRRMGPGLTRLGRWSEGAAQADRNAVYEMLFAVVENSAETTYQMNPTGRADGEYCVPVRRGIVVTIYFVGADMFGLRSIGAVDEAA